jgi:hypothetical protein
MASSELKDGKTYRTRDGRLLEAIIAVADADAEDDTEWHRGWVRFRKTLVDLGWRPPAERRKPSMLTNQLPLPWRQEAKR